MSFGVVVELCTLVSFVVIVAGGVQRRVQGWGVVVSVLLFSALIQCAGMAVVVSCFFSFLFFNVVLEGRGTGANVVAVLRLRSRPAFLLWISARFLMVDVHGVLDPPRDHGAWYHSISVLPAC